MRRILDGQRFQPDESTQAMIGMNDQIAWRKRTGLDDDVGGSTLLAGTGEPVAQYVLLGQHRQSLGFEPALERQNCAANAALPVCRYRRPAVHQGNAVQTVLTENTGQTIRGAAGPGGQHDCLA